MPWYVVSVGPSPTSESLIHSAVRMAHADRARLIAVCVATTDPHFTNTEAQRQLARNLDTAREQGAEVVVLRGGDPAQELITYARSRGATRVIVGRNRDRWWKRLLRRPFGINLETLAAGDLEVMTIPSRLPDAEDQRTKWARVLSGVFPFAISALFLVVASAFAFALRSWGAPPSTQVLVLVVAVVAAGAFGLPAALAAALGAVLVFNYGFTEPLYSLWVDDPWNWLVFAFMLFVGLVVGSLTQRLRTQTALVLSRERRLESLYRLGRELARAGTVAEVEQLSRELVGSASGVLRDSMEGLVSSARERVVRTREAQAARFLQGLSHDFRTPLAIVAGAARALSQSATTRLEAEERELLSTIEQEALTLSAQLETVLDLARLAEPSLERHRQWVPSEEILLSCRDAFLHRGRLRSLVVKLPSELSLVLVEPSLIERALLNLVENADRYSAPSTAVELGCVISPGLVRFFVADRGPGVLEHEKQQVFERFFRGTAARTQPTRRGTGLGLALVREIARAHGGEAWVSDRDGGGSEFSITIPVTDAPPEVPGD